MLGLCTGNSCRYQLRHGYLAQLLGEHATVYGAGAETHGVNQHTLIPHRTPA